MVDQLRKLPPATTPQQEIDNLVAIFRAIASPAYPFPGRWAREAATLSQAAALATRARRSATWPRPATKLPPLSRIAVPTLVISGADDPLIRPAAGRAVARQIPGAPFVAYPGMGHDLPEELWPDIIARMKS